MDKILNRLDYAKSIYEKGFSSDSTILFNMKLLSLYLYQEKGLKKKDIHEKLLEYINKYEPDYNIVMNFKNINSALNYGTNKKNKLFNLEYIKIYKEDIDYIESMDFNLQIKKIMFTYLTLNRLKNKQMQMRYGDDVSYSYTIDIVVNNYTKIKKIGNIKTCTNLGKEINYPMVQRELINSPNGRILYLHFIKQIPEGKKLIFKLTDLEHIGLAYEMLTGNKKIKICDKCGTLFRTTKANMNKKIYCTNCAKPPLMKEKRIECIDCGKSFVVNSKDNHTVRCKECLKPHKKELKRLEMQRYRERKRSM